MREYFERHTEWYWERYYEISGESISYKAAWEAVEKEHYERFQFYKFEEYGAFRVQKSRRMSKKRPRIAKNQTRLIFPGE